MVDRPNVPGEVLPVDRIVRGEEGGEVEEEHQCVPNLIVHSLANRGLPTNELCDGTNPTIRSGIATAITV